MTNRVKFLMFFLVFVSAVTNLQAITKTTNQAGVWGNPLVWSPAGVPGEDDQVIINHEILVYDIFPVKVFSVRIENISDQKAALVLELISQMEITGDMEIVSGNFNSLAALEMPMSSMLTINQNFSVNRTIDNAGLGSFRLELAGSSKLTVNGNFNLNFDGANTNENIMEFESTGNSKFTVIGIVTKNISSGSVLNWEQKGGSQFLALGDYNLNMTNAQGVYLNIKGSSLLQVGAKATFQNSSTTSNLMNIVAAGNLNFQQNLEIISSVAGAGIGFYLTDGASSMRVAGGLDLKAQSEGTIIFDLASSSKFYFGGNLTRLASLGKLNMSANSMWVYTGGTGQAFIDPTGAGNDSFVTTNVGIEIPEGEKMVLSNDLTVTGKLELTQGILESSESAMLIIEDGATISGGSSMAYVEGPVKKVNLVAGVPFTFPLGHQGVYAPMTIEEPGGRSVAKGEFTSKYLNCPPPWPGMLATNIQQLSSQEHWTLNRSEGSSEINVRLHWTDATAQGITNTDDLVVAMYNPDVSLFPTFPGGWTSIGQQDLVGGVGNGVSGSIMNIGTCPPPWGIELFSFASTSNSNALPVEMESFNAKLTGEFVKVQWRTSNEVDVDYFVVEKSFDGQSFFELDKIGDQDQYNSNGAYEIKDLNPQTGNNYYRILQVDFDGMSAYSEIKSVKYEPTPNLFAFPNPANEYVSLTGNIVAEAKYLDVVDGNGRVFFTKEFENPSDLIEISLNELNINITGFYYIKLSNGNRSESVKIFKN